MRRAVHRTARRWCPDLFPWRQGGNLGTIDHVIASTGPAHSPTTGHEAMSFDDSGIRWRAFGSAVAPDAEGRHPSDGLYYWVLDADTGRQVVDILFRLDPGAICQPHRHLGPTATFVVAGTQLNLTLRHGSWAVVEERPTGFFTANHGDHFHREGRGPDGATVHLTMTAVDGVVWHVLDDDGAILAKARITDFVDVLELQSTSGTTLPRPASGL